MATTGMALPFDFQSEQAGIDRKREIVKSLLGALTGPQGQMVSGHYVPVGGFLGGLAPLAQALTAKFVGDRTQQQQKDLTQKYNAGLGGALDNYLTTRSGKAGETLSDAQAHDVLINDQPPPSLQGPTAADPRRAAIQALTSGYAPLHELGKSDLAELSKEALQDARLAAAAGTKNRGLSTKEILALAGQDKYDPGSVQRAALSNDISLLQPARREHVVNGQVVAGNPDSAYRTLYDGRDQFGPVGPLSPGVMGQINRSTGEAKFGPAGTNVNVSPQMRIINTGETEFSKAVGKDIAGEFKDARQLAQKAYRTKATINQMEELDRKGTFTGATANIATSLSAIAAAVGLPVDRSKLANSEAFQQQFAKEIADVLTSGGGVGRSMTDADREAFAKSLPSLLLTKEGRQQVFAMVRANADADISRATSFQERLNANPLYKDAAGLLTLNPVDQSAGEGVRAPAPTAPVPGAGNPSVKVKNW